MSDVFNRELLSSWNCCLEKRTVRIGGVGDGSLPPIDDNVSLPPTDNNVSLPPTDDNVSLPPTDNKDLLSFSIGSAKLTEKSLLGRSLCAELERKKRSLV